jgi:hypothetical protein
MVMEVRQHTPPAAFAIPRAWRRVEDAARLHLSLPRFVAAPEAEAALKTLLAQRACAAGLALAPPAILPAPGRVPDRNPGPAPGPGANPGGQQPAGFTFPASTGPHAPLDFPARHPPIITKGVKRRRHGLDVDGPSTADLSCKKRRLRAQLITSRLSQPFSQPATHILNREGLKAGDKRFLKIATSIDTARRVAHLHATSLLRFSLVNSMRRRLSLVGRTAPATPRPREPTPGDEVDASPWLPPQSLQAASGGRYLQPTGSISPGAGAAVDRGSPAVSKTPACRLSKPAALPRPSADAAVASERVSPRIHPAGSPELGPLRTYDDLDEDCFAFLHPEDDDLDDVTDDPEHVYSDFGVIFGGGGGPGQAAASEDHSYEEYLDELDGISWVTG